MPQEYPRIEDWGHSGMPPLPIEVLDRQVISATPKYRHEKVWIKGHHIHLGTLIFGHQGAETVVERHLHKPDDPDQNFFVLNREGWAERIEKR